VRRVLEASVAQRSKQLLSSGAPIASRQAPARALGNFEVLVGELNRRRDVNDLGHAAKGRSVVGSIEALNLYVSGRKSAHPVMESSEPLR
jgi:hypothetical protein